MIRIPAAVYHSDANYCLVIFSEDSVVYLSRHNSAPAEYVHRKQFWDVSLTAPAPSPAHTTASRPAVILKRDPERLFQVLTLSENERGRVIVDLMSAGIQFFGFFGDKD